MGRTQLNIRMSDGEKAEWDSYAEESRWDDTLTDFVKTAVREKIERMDGEDPASDFDIPEPAVGPQSGELLDKLQDLENELGGLQSDVSQAVDGLHAQTGVDPDLQPKVFEHLPEDPEKAVTAEEYARRIGEKTAAVRFALENMRRADLVEREVPQEVVDSPKGPYGIEQEPEWYRVE